MQAALAAGEAFLFHQVVEDLQAHPPQVSLCALARYLACQPYVSEAVLRLLLPDFCRFAVEAVRDDPATVVIDYTLGIS